MNSVPGLDYYFDRVLHAYLDRYFEETEDRILNDDLDFTDKDE
jgi:hypothetical protein